LFKKPGGVAAARGPWEKQVAAVLRVFGFQCSVFGKSQEYGTEPQNSTPVSVKRRPDGADTGTFFP
jgi:hypothetical protein